MKRLFILLLVILWSITAQWAVAQGKVPNEQKNATHATNVSEPALLIDKGGASKAQGYSYDHYTVVLHMALGSEDSHSAEKVAKAIKSKLFDDVPLAIFIDEPIIGKSGFLCTGYIRGNKFKDDYTLETILNLDELFESAGQMKNKHRNPTRIVNKDNIGITEFIDNKRD